MKNPDNSIVLGKITRFDPNNFKQVIKLTVEDILEVATNEQIIEIINSLDAYDNEEHPSEMENIVNGYRARLIVAGMITAIQQSSLSDEDKEQAIIKYKKVYHRRDSGVTSILTPSEDKRLVLYILPSKKVDFIEVIPSTQDLINNTTTKITFPPDRETQIMPVRDMEIPDIIKNWEWSKKVWWETEILAGNFR